MANAPGEPVSRPCWLVQLPGREPFAMVGERCTRSEAEAAARVIWPDAVIVDSEGERRLTPVGGFDGSGDGYGER